MCPESGKLSALPLVLRVILELAKSGAALAMDRILSDLLVDRSLVSTRGVDVHALDQSRSKSTSLRGRSELEIASLLCQAWVDPKHCIFEMRYRRQHYNHDEPGIDRSGQIWP